MPALLAFQPAAGHDQLWFLLIAKRWLEGAQLYGPEIFDSNPPMVVWLSAIPVRLAALAGVPATFLAKACVVLLWACTGLLSYRLLVRAWRRVQASELPALLFAFVTLFLAVPARDLGQRDALAALLVLPYVLASATVAKPPLTPGWRTVAVLLGAVAFCLKPQDAFIAVAVETSLLLPAARGIGSVAAGWRLLLGRFEPFVLILCGLLYVLAIRLFAPLYFTEALPILRQTYWAIGGLSVPALFSDAIELTILASLLLLLMLLYRPVSGAVGALAIAGLGAFLAYLQQGTGWYYQQLPAICLFGAALALHLLDLHRRRTMAPPAWCVWALAGLCLLGVALTTHFTGYPFTADRAFAITSPDPSFFRTLAPGTPVAILTTSVDEAMMPVERYHLTWAQRTNNLWLLPAILRNEPFHPGRSPSRQFTPLTRAWLDSMQHRWMVEDLKRWKPKLVLIERCRDPDVHCQELEDRHDDLLAWFQRDPAFNRIWGSYTFAGTRDRFDSYTLKPQP